MILAYLSVILLISVYRSDHPSVLEILLNETTLVPNVYSQYGSWLLGLFLGLMLFWGIIGYVSRDKKAFLTISFTLECLVLASIFIQPLMKSGWVIVAVVVSLAWGVMIDRFYQWLASINIGHSLINYLKDYSERLTVALIISSTLFFIIFSIYWYYSFNYPTWDLGLFDEVVYKISIGETPSSSIKGFAHIFQDHFNPILYAYGLLYRLWSSPLVLLTTQSLIFGLSIYLIWLTLKVKLPKIMASGLIIPAIFYFGIQNTLAFGFYPESLALLGLASFFYLLETGRYNYLLLTMPLVLLGKENGGLYLILMGAYIALKHKEKIRGSLMVIIGLLWLTLAVKVIIPAFGPGIYHHSILPFPGSLGENINRILSNPFSILGVLGSPDNKIETYIYTFGYFLFIPLLNVKYMVFFIVPLIFERFIPNASARWSTVFHYSLPLLIPLTLGFGDQLQKWKDKKVNLHGQLTDLRVVNIIVFATIICSLIFSSTLPFRRIVYDLSSQLVSNKTNSSMLREVSELIPEGSSLLVTDRLGVRFSQTQDVYLYMGFAPEEIDQNYVLMSKTLEHWPLSSEDLEQKIDMFMKSDKYSLIYSKNGWYLFKNMH